MPARPPQWGLEPWPDDGEEPTAHAELRIRPKIRDGDEGHDGPRSEQVTPASNKAWRIVTMLLDTRFGAVLRIAVRPEDGSQMLAAIERIIVTLIWAVTATVTVGIVTATALPASAVIAIIGLELTGLAVALLATRWRHRKNKLVLQPGMLAGIPLPPKSGPHPQVWAAPAVLRAKRRGRKAAKATVW